MHPYCRHLRELDLLDLSALLDRLDGANFRKVSEWFFSGDLARFHHVMHTTRGSGATRLDFKQILFDVGDLIIQRAPMLEAISEPAGSDILSRALPVWAPRLSHLQELDMWDCITLEDEAVRDCLHTHCAKLCDLKIYVATGNKSDHHLAWFISGMSHNVLRSFYNVSTLSIGAETCLALNSHGRSLKTLKLELEEEGLLALGLVQTCTQLQTLHLVSSPSRPSTDLKATQPDVYLDIVGWLKHCSDLTEVSIRGLVSAPDLLLPVLLNEKVKLTSLEVSGSGASMSVVKDHRDFDKALGTQSDLQSLSLRVDPDSVTRDDVEALLDSLCRLTNLRELHLCRISDYFTNEHIKLLAQHLIRLETLHIGSYGITDAVWKALGCLKHLKYITFAGLTAFSADGIQGFIERLGAGNSGLTLSIDMADPDTMLSEESQDGVRAALASKVDGKFEYQPLQDPNMPEFGESDLD
ncbi:hypothetical protein LTS12_026054 [Elasticomyces elasticus]|nr:hypothetical protein LTS12_026054 [Elasticomyces elasticus]